MARVEYYQKKIAFLEQKRQLLIEQQQMLRLQQQGVEKILISPFELSHMIKEEERKNRNIIRTRESFGREPELSFND